MSSASLSSAHQLQAIQAMMESGHHSVKMERHTLLIWGITAALLIMVADELFKPENFTVAWQRVLGQTVFISIFLFLAGLWDFKLTRKVRQQRDETLSFVQVQVTKVWWFIIGLIVLINVGMNFFGGGYMFYGLTLALIGLAFYIHGLFSTQMLKWIGSMLILLGLASVALNLHILASKWLAVGVFGLGFPLLAFILDKPLTHSTLIKRLLLSAAWCLIVILPSSFAYQAELEFEPSGLPQHSLAEYLKLDTNQAAQTQIVTLPAGTEIPVQLNINGEMLQATQTTALTMKLTKPLDIIVTEHKATGRFQLAGQGWRRRIHHLAVRDFKMESSIAAAQGPQINLGFRLEVR